MIAGDGDVTRTLGFWELLEYIVEEAPPTLPPRDGRFSPQLCDFVSKCLVKDCKQRPTIEVLSKHEFLQMYKDTNLADLLNWAMGRDGSSSTPLNVDTCGSSKSNTTTVPEADMQG